MRGTKAVQVQPMHYMTVFREAIMAALFPNNFKTSNISPYNGRGDPTVHVEVFHSWMNFKKVLELARS